MNNLNTKLKTPELIRRKFTAHVLPSAWDIGLKLAVNTMLPRVSCEVANDRWRTANEALLDFTHC